MKPLSANRIRAAWVIAIVIDATQIGLVPLTGTLSTWLDKPLDFLAMFLLWRLLGWHWVLLPTFVVEFLPFAEMAPTWSASVWFMTRQGPSGELQTREAQTPEIQRPKIQDR